MSKNLAIIGASALQLPLINKAKEMGYTTHVFAWGAGDVGEAAADFFYPISIVEREEICEKCREIGICGICSIASDLAMLTVNFVAESLGLAANSMECTEISTNKELMRRAFSEGGDPSPISRSVGADGKYDISGMRFPLIVKPADRSGSRGIFKIKSESELPAAIEGALKESFCKTALVEEFAEGIEYSVECISFKGKHRFLAMTRKFTTGAPHFIETGHLQPAPVENALLERVKAVVFHALDSLKITTGASHSELKIAEDGTIRLIEIGGRMGGDYIGSHLVELSTGFDFVKAVVQIAAGEEPSVTSNSFPRAAGVRFVFGQEDVDKLNTLKAEAPELLVFEEVAELDGHTVTDSSSRFGAFLMSAESPEALKKYLPYEK